jgi:hypothetical protein
VALFHEATQRESRSRPASGEHLVSGGAADATSEFSRAIEALRGAERLIRTGR